MTGAHATHSPVTAVADLGGPLHHVDFGGSGPTLVLLHGLGGAYINWLSVTPQLLAAGYRVRAVDWIGFGGTPLAGRRSTIANNTELLARYLDEVVGEPVTLVGNSMGGHIGIFAAAAHPALVNRLVLVNPAIPASLGPPNEALVAALFVSMSAPGLGELAMEGRLRASSPERLVRGMLALTAADPSRLDAALVDLHIEHTAARHAERDSDRAFLQASRSLLASLVRRRRFFEKAERVTVPTLLIHGRRDRLIPVAAATGLARRRPAWRLHVFEELGHIPMMEDPEAFLDVLLPWLRKTASVARTSA